MALTTIFFLAVMVEGLVTYGSGMFKRKKFQWKMFLAAIIGVIASFNFQIDLFEILGLTGVVPVISKILTGILIGRGSNYVADFIKTAQGLLKGYME